MKKLFFALLFSAFFALPSFGQTIVNSANFSTIKVGNKLLAKVVGETDTFTVVTADGKMVRAQKPEPENFTTRFVEISLTSFTRPSCCLNEDIKPERNRDSVFTVFGFSGKCNCEEGVSLSSEDEESDYPVYYYGHEVFLLQTSISITLPVEIHHSTQFRGIYSDGSLSPTEVEFTEAFTIKEDTLFAGRFGDYLLPKDATEIKVWSYFDEGMEESCNCFIQYITFILNGEQGNAYPFRAGKE